MSFSKPSLYANFFVVSDDVALIRLIYTINSYERYYENVTLVTNIMKMTFYTF